MNNNDDNNSNVIINFGKKYTFGEMIDKLSEDSTLSFVSNGILYFKRKDKLLTTKYNNSTAYSVAHAKPMPLDNKIALQSFYETNIYISDIIYEVNIEDIRDLMLEGKIIMLCLNDRTWVMNVEDNVVFLDYSEADGANEDNYKELFAEDVLTSLLEGQWYVIDEDECTL